MGTDGNGGPFFGRLLAVVTRTPAKKTDADRCTRTPPQLGHSPHAHARASTPARGVHDHFPEHLPGQ